MRCSRSVDKSHEEITHRVYKVDCIKYLIVVALCIDLQDVRPSLLSRLQSLWSCRGFTGSRGPLSQQIFTTDALYLLNFPIRFNDRFACLLVRR